MVALPQLYLSVLVSSRQKKTNNWVENGGESSSAATEELRISLRLVGPSPPAAPLAVMGNVCIGILSGDAGDRINLHR